MVRRILDKQREGRSSPSRRIPDADLTGRFELRSLFPAPAPLEVDIGCGKGRFLLARAAANPSANFLGIDRLPTRVDKVGVRAARAGLGNVRVVCLDAAHAVEHFLPPESVGTFYSFFSDPWPKRRHHLRRLWSTLFVASLHRALAPGGLIHAATDHAGYLAEIRELLDADGRFAEIPPFVPPLDQRTDFEILFVGQGATVHRCSFRKLE